MLLKEVIKKGTPIVVRRNVVTYYYKGHFYKVIDNEIVRKKKPLLTQLIDLIRES